MMHRTEGEAYRIATIEADIVTPGFERYKEKEREIDRKGKETEKERMKEKEKSFSIPKKRK